MLCALVRAALAQPARQRAVPLEANLDAQGRATPLGIDLDRLELELAAGRLGAAKALLARHRGAPRPGTRQLNAAGLLALLEGRPDDATALLRAALADQPFGPAHLAAHKNLYWAAYQDPRLATDNDGVDAAWSAVIGAFERSREESTASPPLGVTIFDVGFAGHICRHEMYDRNRGTGTRRGGGETARWREQYFDLLKKALTDFLHRDLRAEFEGSGEAAAAVCEADPEGCESDWQITQAAGRLDGPYAQKRLGGLVHIQLLINDVLEGDVPGDLIEAGCYTGATAVFMRALLEQDGGGGQPQRRLFLADSFEGIPQPRTARGLRVDGPGVAHGSANWPERYAAGQAQVRSTFRRYGLLDERVVLVPGYFNVSLPGAPIGPLALIHVDADAYESVLDALAGLYPRLSPGGHVIVDDFHLPGVRQAVHEYREEHRIHEPLWPVPTDYVTTCRPADGGPAHPLTDFQVEPLTVAYWTKGAGGLR